MTTTKVNNLEQALSKNRYEWLGKLKEISQELIRDKAGLIGVVLITSLILMAELPLANH